MSTELTTIDTAALETITGGAGGVDANANINVGFDVNRAIDQAGELARRTVGCATGASSLREFGNCILTGQLGNVPPAPQPTPAAPPAPAP